jgi:uncharacterized membrane protein
MQAENVKEKNKEIFLLFCVLAIGLVLRLNNLSGRSLWTDEFFTLFQSSGHGVDIENFLDSLSHKQTPELLKAEDLKRFLQNDPAKSIKDVSKGLLYTDTHPPLYFWIMYVWMKVFGDNASAIRFFSVLMGLAAIFLAYRVGTYLFNTKVAFFCALFMSISTFAVRYSQEARSYALIMVLGLLSCLSILRFEKYNKNSDIFCFAIFNALGIYTHYFYSFLVIAQFVYFIIVSQKDREKNEKFYLAFLGSLLLLSGWVIPVILKGYNFRKVEWIFGYPGLINKIGYLCVGMMRFILMFDKPTILEYLFLSVGSFCFIYMVFRGLKEGIPKYPSSFLFALIMFLTPLLGIFFLDIVQHGALLKQERFWMFSFLGFLFFAGYSLNYGFLKNKLVVLVILGLILLSSATVGNSQFGPAPKNISQWINKESKGGSTAVIVFNIRSVVFAQGYYLNDDIYLIPVFDEEQLKRSIKIASRYVGRIFIVRHHHRTDPSLMDQPFMAVRDMGSGFKFKADIQRDDVSVAEYIKCEL